MEAEIGQKRQLQLCHRVAGHAHEDVVEAAVIEPVLDPCAADPADLSIDDEHLAVIEVAELLKPPVDTLIGAE